MNESVAFSNAFGTVLKEQRSSKDLSLRKVAATAHVSLSHLSEIERSVKGFTPEVLSSICNALDLPIRELLLRAAAKLEG